MVEIVLKTMDSKLTEEIAFLVIRNHLLLLFAQNKDVILTIILLKYKILYSSYTSLFISEFSKNPR
jgi:hypothetical protein